MSVHDTADHSSPLEPLRSAQFRSAREYESGDVGSESPREGPVHTAPLQANIVCKRYRSLLTFSEETQTIKITRVTQAGKQKTILFVPLYVVLNLETAAERDARQTSRQANDDTTKESFVLRDGTALQAACMGNCSPPAGGAGDDRRAGNYTHLRGDTGISMATTTSLGASAVSFHTPLDRSEEVYSLHYVRVAARVKKSIHTVTFTAAANAVDETAALVRRLLRAVYRGGAKHLLFFISPKSGSGHGEKIFEREVKPLLHFTRHKVTTYVTQRAHDCEDYCADANNDLSAQHVVVAVGGDGMANEVINGLHRRKIAILAHLRNAGDTASSTGSSAGLATDEYPTEDTGSTTTGPGGAAATSSPARGDMLAKLRVPRHFNVTTLLEEGWNGTLPLVATLATGSACGLAKSLGVLSPAEAALALVHLNTVDMDLLRMNFTANEDLVRHHEERFSVKKRARVRQQYQTFQDTYAAQDEAIPASTSVSPPPARQAGAAHHADPAGDGGGASGGAARAALPGSGTDGSVTHTADDDLVASPASPFRMDGSGRFSTAVAHHLGAPDMQERVAFMSLSFGMANDIDRGSEHLRWMGNSRFAVYGGYCLLRGVRKYQTTLRYLPWKSADTGKGLEKLHAQDVMPSLDELPICTMRADCPHCCANQPVWAAERQAKMRGLLAHAVSTSDHASADIVNLLEMEDEDVTLSEVAQTLRAMSESELLNEETVDFNAPDEDEWVTITGSFYNILLCNLRDIAQDMNMAPRCHMSDGAIDVVFSRIMPGVTTGGGRREFLKMMGSLENGGHVDYGFVNYVKARAVEIKVDDGISMSDGEMMPLSSVHLTKMRNAVRFVRSD